MDNKKNKIMTMVFIVSMLLLVVSTTYAFFAPQQGGTTSTNATVTSNTTDILTFSINRDISFTVTQALFAENGTNQSGDATATATLTPNNKTGAATMNYYLYLNIESNPTVYSATNTNEDPELMLQVFDGNNQLVTLTGLGTQKTIKGVTGYDITGVSGLKTLLDNHAISASNNTAAIENWRIVITLINLDVNQNDNTGKTIGAEIIISKEEVDLGFTGTIYTSNSREVPVLIGESIVPLTNVLVYCQYNSEWEDDSCNYGSYWDNLSDCEEYLINSGMAIDGYECRLETRNISGVNFYSTTYNNGAQIDVYCAVENGETTCDNYSKYYTRSDCETENVGRTCILDYVIEHVYLKHEVVNNNVVKNYSCIWLNNHEYCIEPRFWDTDSTTTLAKLKADMELALGVEMNNNCTLDNGIPFCKINEDGCYARADGIVSCVSGEYQCTSTNLGNSYCFTK